MLTGGEGADRLIFDITALQDAENSSIADTVTDFAVGTDGDLLDLAAIHTSSLAAGSGDLWSGSEFAYAHGYISFVQSGANTLVQYDRDGLNSNSAARTVATLTGVTASQVLAGINSTPAKSDKLYLIETVKFSTGLNEDSDATLTYRIVLGKTPTANVTVNIQGGDQISVNGSSGTVPVTFTAANWWVPQTITIRAADDLLIEGNDPTPLVHSFTSADPTFNGLSDSLSVSVVDNDFVRTLEPVKLPSTGNNAIEYDRADDLYAITAGSTSTGNTQYDLGDGTDWLRVSESVQSAVNTRLFLGGTGNDTLLGVVLGNGGDGNDLLEAAANTRLPNVNEYARLSGGLGNDTLIGGTGPDALVGGSGSDSLSGGGGNDWLMGDQTDTATVGGGINNSTQLWRPTATFFTGLADTIYGGLGDDTIDGAAGDDRLFGEEGSDSIVGGPGNDSLVGDVGNDTLLGDDGNDTIDSGFGNDSIVGGTGNDTISAGEGADSVNAGDGLDTIEGSFGNDTILGGLQSDLISGGADDDRLFGEAGLDTLSGGTGNDSLDGGDDADTITGAEGNDTLDGGTGDDRLQADEGDDRLIGGDGNDTLLGGLGADWLGGGNGNNYIDAGPGVFNDQLTAGAGNDTLIGDEGNDTLDGGDGKNLLDGGDGNDRLSAGVGDDSMLGGAGNDWLSAGDGNNTLSGGLGTDTLSSGLGADQLSGGDGNDSLTSGAGNDALDGGAGNDTLTGGAGQDVLSGGDGSDLFIFKYTELEQQLPDVINDFQTGSGGDILDLADIHAQNITAGYTQWPAAQFPYSLGYIRLVQDGSDTIVGYDRDGHNKDFTFKSVIRLLDTDALSLTADNLTLVSENFGIARNGVVAKQTILKGSTALLDVRLWGGQPSSNVLVNIYDKFKSNALLGSLTFTPADWSNTKQLAIVSSQDADLDLTLGLTFSLVSTDVDYSGKTLVAGVIGDNLVFERPRLTVPELSVFANATDTLSISLSPNFTPASTAPTPVTFLPEDTSLAPILATLTWVNGVPRLVIENPNTWVGNQQWTGIVVIDGQELVIPLTLRNYGDNILSVVTATSVAEGNSGVTTLQASFVLSKPAGEMLQFNWNVTGASTNGVDAVDFIGGVLPSGIVTFNRGESVKTIQFHLNADTAVEANELLKLNLSLATTPATNLTLLTTTASVVVQNDDQQQYLGTAAYWKNDIPLNLLTGWVVENTMPLDTNSSVNLRNVTYAPDTLTMRAEVWVSSASVVSNLDLHFLKPDTASFTATAAPGLSTWSLIQNDRGDQFDIASIGTEAVSGEVRLLDLVISNIAPDQSLYLTRGTVGDFVLNPRSLLSTNVLSINNGQVNLNAIDGDYALFNFTAPASSKTLLSIDSRDALLALKIGNGSLLQANLASPYQVLAADVNNSGKVDALDAWLILRKLVGFDTPTVGQWQMVNASKDASALSAQAAWKPGLDSYDLQSGSDVQIVGVIKGDIDGSWALLG